MKKNIFNYPMKITMTILQVDQVAKSYVNWFDDKAVIRFSNNQNRLFSLDSQREYVKECLDNEDIDLYGIFADSLHIGNITISGLNSLHRRAELSYVIGDRNYWGLGIASFAIFELVQLGTKKYGLNKLYAGVASGNIASIKALEKNGFKREGVRENHLIFDGIYYDQHDYGLLLGT